MKEAVDLNKIANTEILNILKHISYEYSSKIPIKYIEFLRDNSIEDEANKYSGFDEDGNIKVSSLAEEILDYLNLEYWTTEDEKKKLIEIYTKNEKELNKKYNSDNLFKNKENKITTDSEENSLAVVQEKSIITKIFEKIKQWLKIKE